MPKLNAIIGCNWQTINGFVSPGEYQRFCAWLDTQIQSGLVEEVETNKEKLYFGDEEKWFKCKSSEAVWRLAAPEFPFRGLWDAIDE